MLLVLLLLLFFLQDPVWAEQAHVFPDWHSYSSELSKRAALADRHWLDSIGLSTEPTTTAAAVAAAKDGQRQTKHSIITTSAAAGSKAVQQAAGVLGRASTWLNRLAARREVQ